jgi:hypothetical protein
MAYPWVTVGGDGLQIWRVAVNTLNMQSWITNKGGTPAWGLGKGLKTHHKTSACYKMLQKASKLDGFFGT